MVHSANNAPLFSSLNLPSAKRYWIAFSGGLDSTALLFAMSKLADIKPKLRAIHINHNINAASNDWAMHCQSTCDRLGIPLITEPVHLSDHSENSCRQARLAAYRKHLNQGDCLVTAHHQNDQVETLLFRLFRGTGLQGVTGMQAHTDFNQFTIARPLLNIDKSTLIKYVADLAENHIEDPSNQDPKYSRNHLRLKVIPGLIDYQPKVLDNIALTAKNLAQSARLLSELVGHNNPIRTNQLTSQALLQTYLYHWLYNLGIQPPSHKQLAQFSHDCWHAAEDKLPELVLSEYTLRQWQRQIYAINHNHGIELVPMNISLIANQPIDLQLNNGHLLLESDQHTNLKAQVKYGQTKEKLQMHNHGPHKSIKKLLQEHHVPPWERDRLPYLFINGKLMAVGSNIQSFEFKQLLTQYNAQYRWLSATKFR